MAGLAIAGKMLEKFMDFVMLGWVNRLLGIAFSLLKCALIVGLVIMAFNSLNNTFNFISEEELSQSMLYPPLKSLAYTVFPYLKDMLFWK